MLRVQHAGIKIGGEIDGIGNLLAKSLENQVLIIKIGAQNTDGLTPPPPFTYSRS